jgi:hypothetical protein
MLLTPEYTDESGPVRPGNFETPGASVYFYELHEGDNDVFADLMLAREEEMDADEFLLVVQSIRERIIETHDRDTLIEAIAEELESDYEFIYISDDRLTAAVNVSKDPGETFLTDLEPELDVDDEVASDDDDDDEDPESVDYKVVVAEVQGLRPRPH